MIWSSPTTTISGSGCAASIVRMGPPVKMVTRTPVGLRPGSVRWLRRADRAVAGQSHPVHDPGVALVVEDAEVHGGPVVPHCERPRAPVVTDDELGPRHVVVEELEEPVALRLG